MARLNERLFARLEEERDVAAPRHDLRLPAADGGAARRRSTQFVSDVFASTQFDQPILLRGVYFTSGTQDGTPIDRLLGAIGRRFGVAPDAVAPPAGRGKAYFVERLLKDVMIGESGLAGVNRRLEMQKGGVAARRLRGAGAGRRRRRLVALSVSYSRNRAYLDAGGDATSRASRRCRRCRRRRSLEALLPRLDAVRAVVRFGEPVSRRHAVGDALGTLSGQRDRQCRARRLPARARRHPAAAVRGARQAAADRVRVGARKSCTCT